MRLWIDVVNAPHVRFFRRFLRIAGGVAGEVLITAREFGQLALMARAAFEGLSGVRLEVVGG
ncbi:MAG: hypothetical protein DRO06_00860, partial [Thermoproteota archaeon]